MQQEVDRLLAEGRGDEAVAWLEQVAEQASNQIDVWLLLGRTRAKLGDYEGALVVWRRVSRDFPARLEGPYEAAAALLRLNRIEEAKRLYGKLQATFRFAPHGGLGMAQAFVTEGDWESAVRVLTALMNQFPGRPDTRFLRGYALKELGRLDEAEADFSYVLTEAYPYNSTACAELIEVLQRQHRFADAKALVHRFWTQLPQRSEDVKPRGMGVIGESHIIAVREGWVAGGFHELDAEFITLPRHHFVDGAGGIVREYVDLIARAQGFAGIALAVGGNEHSVLGLARHPIAFSLARQPGPQAFYLTSGMADAMLRESMKAFSVVVRFLSTVLPQPLFMLESPPPCPSEKHVRDSIETALAKETSRYGVAPAWDRLVLWRARCSVAAALARELGITYVSAPSESMDEHGFLLEHLWGNATHANLHYGTMVRDQLVRLMANQQVAA